MKIDFEKYQSDLGQEGVKIVLETLFCLKMSKIQERKDKKTPDYEILDENGNTIGYCEVKSFTNIGELSNPEEGLNLEKFTEISIKRDKNHRSKISKHNGKAMQQLAFNSSLPNIVIFVSFDMTDHIDMDNVFQFQKEIYPNNSLADVYVMMKVHQSIMPSDTFEIKQAIQFRYSTQLGKDFVDTHLSPAEALLRSGTLPLIFKLN